MGHRGPRLERFGKVRFRKSGMAAVCCGSMDLVEKLATATSGSGLWKYAASTEEKELDGGQGSVGFGKWGFLLGTTESYSGRGSAILGWAFGRPVAHGGLWMRKMVVLWLGRDLGLDD